MVSALERELFKSTIDPSRVCGKRVMANSVLFMKCENWVHGNCSKIKRDIRLAMSFAFLRCKRMMKRMEDLIEKLCNKVEPANGFCQ